MHPKTLLATALALAIFTGSCKKLDDYIRYNPTATCDACKIVQFKIFINSDSSLYTVNYDKKGNMVSIISDKPYDYYVNYDYYFRYDKSNRLSDKIYLYHGNLGGAVIWESFKYFPGGKIVDTSYLYSGNIADPTPPINTAFSKRYEELKTDFLGRIVKAVRYDNGNVATANYNYNSAGNLIYYPPLPIYDNKINPYRTNPVWQLTLRDYSANNAIQDPADVDGDYRFPVSISYNSNGLPVKYRKNQYSSTLDIFGYVCDSLQVIYDCNFSKYGY